MCELAVTLGSWLCRDGPSSTNAPPLQTLLAVIQGTAVIPVSQNALAGRIGFDFMTKIFTVLSKPCFFLYYYEEVHILWEGRVLYMKMVNSTEGCSNEKWAVKRNYTGESQLFVVKTDSCQVGQ